MSIEADRRVVLWDFDGTLAERPGRWRSCLLRALDEHDPAHTVTDEQIRPLLHDGFPWHTPEIEHPELNSPDAWWAHVQATLARAYQGVGIELSTAKALAEQAARTYVDLRYWRLYDDTLPALTMLTKAGWRHIIVSNHVPELGTMIDGLGIGSHFAAVINSAATGFEKPHPGAFHSARGAAGDPAEIWMVGDNPEADIRGAEQVGIPAILVDRSIPHEDSSASRVVHRLTDLCRWLDPT